MLRDMNKKQVIKRAGGVVALARLLGISHQAVSKWPALVPAQRAYEMRYLRPDLFGLIK